MATCVILSETQMKFYYTVITRIRVTESVESRKCL